MDDLHCIVYTSSAVRLLNQNQIDHLLSRARERNQQHDVTGLLLYGAGSFMQYIEGPHEGIMSIYEIILHDPLHHTIIELLNRPIRNREFESWEMAYSKVQKAELKPILETDWKLQKGESSSAGQLQGRQLLAAFWRNQNRFSARG